MTLNGIMRYSTEFGSFGDNYAKVVEGRPILSAIKYSARTSFLAIYDLWRYPQRFVRTNSLEIATAKSHNLINTGKGCSH